MTADSLTPKAERTRQHIFETAIRLFTAKGYEATTMRDIAAEADCSLGLTYRYFARKEDLALALYRQLASDTEGYIRTLPPGTLVARFHQVMRYKLAQVNPYREAIGGLFSAAMTPNSGVTVLGDSAADVREQMTAAFRALILSATDAPKEPQVTYLATLLYSAHLAFLLFWVYDRTPETRATHQLLDLARDGLTLARPLLMLPPVAKTLARLATIMGEIFGGESPGEQNAVKEDQTDKGGKPHHP
jgi:AcrR family transcriptional regulator